MSPIPGQRAAQRTVRAMTSSQRALGRSVQAAAGGLATAIGWGWVDGQHMVIDLAAPPGQQTRPAALACGCTGRCRGECPPPEDSEGTQTDTQERQG
ncbi:hypothetical protein GCM10010353_61490 [Streptomyces chryseus]|uniref:Uncharacterized protein n=2 Tax=Streptomyces chryseus TaxID=68186 RepID=A0ABQ3DK19_9ACTN|nr:hypothetical protein GCM10010353_61490 [Streptomyces chryseus]GHA94727.1 hypothetical protein GCM10010346_16920 [Streptomyces chryseus]